MFNNFLEILLLLKYPLLGLFFVLSLLSFCWTPIFNFFKLKTYNCIQRAHKNEVARLGGVVIYLFFLGYILIGFDGR